MTKSLTAIAVLSLVLSTSSVTWAEGGTDQGKHKGFSQESGQGNLDNNNANANPNNNGQTSVEGPKGQIDNGKTDCNKCTQDLPGKNR